ncbi:histidine phosphatase family protein [Streptomyces sp. NPDC007088]|uniref:histidine phosphatase family protein n=1 Tax=Streptomyces sp. NPDC007088 TaxID=3364773 RepID=UPI0036C404C4
MSGGDPRTVGGRPAPADLGSPTTFVLLRHGETALTPERRFSGGRPGTSGPALSPAGREQAGRTAAALARLKGTDRAIEAVISSPLTRCLQTARAAADLLHLPVQVEEGLRETDFGQWEGLTFAEAGDSDPEAFRAWLADPGTPPPGGESFRAVAARVEETRERLRARYPGRTLLLVTHVTPVKTLVRLALGAPPQSLHRMELAPASLTRLAYWADGNASLRGFNDTHHLEPDAAPPPV